jgi:lipopolysaccharide transport system permease protein
MWQGDYKFVLSNLVKKDFKVRYRNMSLGMLWSVLNPLVMMGALAYVFGYSTIFGHSKKHDIAVFLLCGLVPFNFFTMAWSTGTNSLMENYSIMKRVMVPRELFPIATVLGNSVHLAIQTAILVIFTLISGLGVNRHWIMLPYAWLMEMIFVCGLAMATSAINVHIRDTRYVVESINTVLFYFVPIFYAHEDVPQNLAPIYQYNPLAAVIQVQRNIMWQGISPPTDILWKLALSSAVVFLVGLFLFRRLKAGFFDHM